MNSPRLHSFNIDVLQSITGTARKLVSFSKNQIIYSQGQRSDALFYIEKGSVKLTVASKEGKEAVIGIFQSGHLFGESCVAPKRPVRFHNAIALSDMRAIKVDGDAMIRTLLASSRASYSFITYFLDRYAHVQEDLVSNLLGSGAKRLARVLQYLAESGTPGEGECLPPLSQQTLAEMIGTTRQHVNHLMVRFRKLGLVEGDHDTRVHR
jgi:CRP-like cAMP-binding protein